MIRQAARELGMKRSTVYKVLHRRLRLYAYKVQIVQEIKPEDAPKREAFANAMFDRIAKYETFLSRVLFTDEVSFHVSRKVNRHNVSIW